MFAYSTNKPQFEQVTSRNSIRNRWPHPIDHIVCKLQMTLRLYDLRQSYRIPYLTRISEESESSTRCLEAPTPEARFPVSRCPCSECAAKLRGTLELL